MGGSRDYDSSGYLHVQGPVTFKMDVLSTCLKSVGLVGMLPIGRSQSSGNGRATQCHTNTQPKLSKMFCSMTGDFDGQTISRDLCLYANKKQQ